MPVPKKVADAWLAMPASHRALMLRNEADVQWTTVEMQHERLVGYCQGGPINILGRPPRDSVRELADVSLFMTALRRLRRAANLAEAVADPRHILAEQISSFEDRTAGLCLDDSAQDGTDITAIRNALEHFEDLAIRGGLGFGREADGWIISYRNVMFQTKDLLAAARALHRAIRAAVDPAAFQDFHGDRPLIELRTPDEIPPPRDGFGRLVDPI